jgi:hypothetical protein
MTFLRCLSTSNAANTCNFFALKGSAFFILLSSANFDNNNAASVAYICNNNNNKLVHNVMLI